MLSFVSLNTASALRYFFIISGVRTRNVRERKIQFVTSLRAIEVHSEDNNETKKAFARQRNAIS